MNLDNNPNAGQGKAAEGTKTEQTVIIIRDFQPGQVVRIAFLTPEQAAGLPTIPADALQIAVAPAGGL